MAPSPKSPKPKAPRVSKTAPKVVNQFPGLKNGLADALLGIAGSGSIGTQLNQTGTLLINNRGYLISNDRQLLSQSYAEHGLIQTIVDVPVDDGMRGGVEIKTQQLSPDQIDDIQVYLEREDILNSVIGQTSKWNRLYGGAGTLIITDQDPKLPFDINQVNPDSLLAFYSADLWELFNTEQNIGQFGISLLPAKFEFYTFYGHKVHRSRVLQMKGIQAPSFIRPRLRGWGMSVLETLIASINQYLKSNNIAFEVMDEFKLDIFKFFNLSQTLLNADGTAQVQERVRIMNAQKNFQNAMTLDGQDDYIQKQLTFAGIADMYKEFRMQIASDMRMPITKLFGVSATGFNSGEDDIENYNSMVESQIRSKSKFEILKIIEIVCKKLFNMVPDDLRINFKPLRVLSAEQEENVKTQKFNRVLGALNASAITLEQFQDACNQENLLSIQLDPASLDTLESEIEEQKEAETEESKGSPDKGEKKTTVSTKPKEAPSAKNGISPPPFKGEIN